MLLAAALAGSLYLNYWQHIRAVTAPLRAEVADLKHAADTSAGLAKDMHDSGARLLAATEAANDQLRGAGRAYAAARRVRPLTEQCAPGQGRVDAVNRALGASVE